MIFFLKTEAIEKKKRICDVCLEKQNIVNRDKEYQIATFLFSVVQTTQFNGTFLPMM